MQSGSAVWADCEDGSLKHASCGLIVLRAAAMAVLLTGVTACDFYSGGYTTRAKVSEGLNLAGGAKFAIADFHAANNRYPANNAEAGLDAADTINGKFVSRVDVLPGGKIGVTFGGTDPDRKIAGRVLLIEIIGPDADGHFEWRCLAPSIEKRNLPSVCHSDGVPDHRPVIFYLHGRIVEDEGPQAEHQQWGLYDYPAVVEALGRDGAAVVSEQRPSGTDVDAYAVRVALDIERLLAAGFPAERIAVVGFSKGAGIAIRVSSRSGHPDLRYVILAGCGAGIESVPGLVPNGHVLSVVETSDSIVGSCDQLAERNPNLADYREVSISTGQEHGAFYLPREEWLAPVLAWVGATEKEKSQ